jgi:uncharacterized alpha-E superfamily protein
MMLLSRVADNLYWGARYVERAEDTARLVRSYTDTMVDLPMRVSSTWEPLLAINGTRADFDASHLKATELDIVRFLVTEVANQSSIASCVARARENLRTTREVLPREAWQAVNDMNLYVAANSSSGVERRSRSRFLGKVITDCQTLDGVMSTSMSRDEAYELWRLGQTIERADMTTRVVGVRAAALLDHAEAGVYEDVQWMGVLRSVSALQMYQRNTRGPIQPAGVVRFLLLDGAFPRSVASCITRIREALQALPRSEVTLPTVDQLDATISGISTHTDDPIALDAVMDQLQSGLAAVSDAVGRAFLHAEW